MRAVADAALSAGWRPDAHICTTAVPQQAIAAAARRSDRGVLTPLPVAAGRCSPIACGQPVNKNCSATGNWWHCWCMQARGEQFRLLLSGTGLCLGLRPGMLTGKVRAAYLGDGRWGAGARVDALTGLSLEQAAPRSAGSGLTLSSGTNHRAMTIRGLETGRWKPPEPLSTHAQRYRQPEDTRHYRPVHPTSVDCRLSTAVFSQSAFFTIVRWQIPLAIHRSLHHRVC